MPPNVWSRDFNCACAYASLRFRDMADHRQFCPHCSQTLLTKTYKAHKRLYFDSGSNSWIKRRKADPEDFAVLLCFDSDTDSEDDPSNSAPWICPDEECPSIVRFESSEEEKLADLPNSDKHHEIEAIIVTYSSNLP